MNANELANLLLDFDVFHTSYKHLGITETESLFVKAATMLRQQQAEIEALNQRIERMIENASHHEGIAHAGGFEQGHEIGRQLGMKQERALWELSASTQEIEATMSEKGYKVGNLEDIPDRHLTCEDAPFQVPAPKKLAGEYVSYKAELTDEEIIELQAEYGIDSDLTCHSVKDFVLAILRKAQEQ